MIKRIGKRAKAGALKHLPLLYIIIRWAYLQGKAKQASLLAMPVSACRKTFDTLTGCPKRREIGRMEPEGVYEYSER
ncbi:MAG: hypothetical protein IJP38_02980 [Oscillospiraceae bacterium]|nr:hypothetical protein [Oscillospiraceae bacterium]